jgi:hypothetical protein
LRALEPESKNDDLGTIPKTTEKHLKPATGAGLSSFQTTEQIRSLPKQNGQQIGNVMKFGFSIVLTENPIGLVNVELAAKAC